MHDSIFTCANAFFNSTLNFKESFLNFCNQFPLVCFSSSFQANIRKSDKTAEIISVCWKEDALFFKILVFKAVKANLQKSDKPVETVSSDMVKHELRVTSCELRVTSYELKV